MRYCSRILEDEPLLTHADDCQDGRYIEDAITGNRVGLEWPDTCKCKSASYGHKTCFKEPRSCIPNTIPCMSSEAQS